MYLYCEYTFEIILPKDQLKYLDYLINILLNITAKALLIIIKMLVLLMSLGRIFINYIKIS